MVLGPNGFQRGSKRKLSEWSYGLIVMGNPALELHTFRAGIHLRGQTSCPRLMGYFRVMALPPSGLRGGFSECGGVKEPSGTLILVFLALPSTPCSHHPERLFWVSLPGDAHLAKALEEGVRVV